MWYMAAKGTESKNIIFAKLQEIFPKSFWEDQGKILRVPLDENGTRVEIKVTLTAAKNNLKGDVVESAFKTAPSSVTENVSKNSVLEPTEEEKENVAKLIASLGL